MQKWEYKCLHRSRGLKAADKNGYHDPMPWDPPVEFEEIQALGEEGWELIAIKTSSRYGGHIRSTLKEMTGADPDRHFSITAVPTGPVVAGFTTDETFYFKRPKQE